MGVVVRPQLAVVCIVLVAIAWFGNALYAAGAANGPLKTWSPALVAGAMLSFLVLHGARAEGGRAIFAFVVIIFLIGWTAETISIVTGFPFGHYHYTEIMGPFLGHVPVSVMPAYGVMGYISWVTARVLLGRTRPGSDVVLRFAVPLVATALMVLWDLSMDPLRATVEGRWIWRDGGPHYGIPLLNFAGWFIVTLLMFATYALMRGESVALRRHPATETRLFWMSAPLMYLAFPVEYLLNPVLMPSSGEMVLVNDAFVPVGGIHREIAVLTAVTMVPVALLAVVRLFRRRTPQPAPVN